MSSELDDLEALFDTESARYDGVATAPSAPVTTVATTMTTVVTLGADSDAGVGKGLDSSLGNGLGHGAEDGLDRYFQAVSGMYLHDAIDSGDPTMFERLGSIVRQMHDSLRSLGYDKSLAEANSQVIDAKDRLEHIAALTEQSAVKVLNTLEAAMPAQEIMIRQGRVMEERWTQLFDGKLGVEEFKLLAADARAFAADVAAEGEREKARLLEIMMAQDFQDLTGQIIKKVVGVTKLVEQDLALLLLDNAPATVKEKHVELMSGPATAGVALAQADVDDLLGDLGF